MGAYSDPPPPPDPRIRRERAERRYRREKGLPADHDLTSMPDDLLHVLTDDDPLVSIMLVLMCVVPVAFGILAWILT